MLLEIIGLTVTIAGCILGVILVVYGGIFHLFKTTDRVKLAIATRLLGIGTLTVMASIPFSIPNQLLGTFASGDSSIFGAIILSVFLGSPLIAMGMAAYIGLHAKAEQIVNSMTAREKLRYYVYSPMHRRNRSFM